MSRADDRMPPQAAWNTWTSPTLARHPWCGRGPAAWQAGDGFTAVSLRPSERTIVSGITAS